MEETLASIHSQILRLTTLVESSNIYGGEKESQEITIANFGGDLVGAIRNVDELGPYIKYAKSQMVPAADQWRARIKNIANGVLSIEKAINADWKIQDDGEMSKTVTEILIDLVKICVVYAQDPKARWISAPAFRLIHIILLRMAIPLLEPKLSLPPSRDLLKDMNDILKFFENVEQNGVAMEMTKEMFSAFQSMLKDPMPEAAKALGLVVLGTIKSILTWKLDDDLLQGLKRGMAAGHTYFKNLNGQNRLKLICSVSYGTIAGLNGDVLTIGALQTLRRMTTDLNHIKGNWIVEVSWVYELHRTASCALDVLDSLGSGGNEIKRREAEDCLVATLTGTTQGVMGLTRVFHSASKPLTQYKGVMKSMVNGLLDGESLVCVLRSALDEMSGELAEFVETGWNEKTTAFIQKFCDQNLFDALAKDQTRKLQNDVAEHAKTLDKLMDGAAVKLTAAVQQAEGAITVLTTIYGFRKLMFLDLLVNEETMEECAGQCSLVWKSFQGDMIEDLQQTIGDCLVAMSDQVQSQLSKKEILLSSNLSTFIQQLSSDVLRDAIHQLLNTLHPLLSSADTMHASLQRDSKQEQKIIKKALEVLTITEELGEMFRFVGASWRAGRHSKRGNVAAAMCEVAAVMKRTRIGLQQALAALTVVEQVREVAGGQAAAASMEAVLDGVGARFAKMQLGKGSWGQAAAKMKEVVQAVATWASAGDARGRSHRDRNRLAAAADARLAAAALPAVPERLSQEMRQQLGGLATLLDACSSESGAAVETKAQLLEQAKRCLGRLVLAALFGDAAQDAQSLTDLLRANLQHMQNILQDAKELIGTLLPSQASRLLGKTVHGAVVAFVLAKVVKREVDAVVQALVGLKDSLRKAQGLVQSVKKCADDSLNWKRSLIYNSSSFEKTCERLVAALQWVKSSEDLGATQASQEQRLPGMDATIQLASHVGGALQDTLLRASEIFDWECDLGDAARVLMEEMTRNSQLQDEFKKTVRSVEISARDNFATLAKSVTAWGPSLSNLTSIFDSVSEEAKAAAREIMKGIVGPGARPELVQEAALSALLELEPRIRKAAAESAQATTGLGDAHGRIMRVFAMVRSSATSKTLRAMMEQEKFRAVMSEAVQAYWHEVRDEAMRVVQNRAQVQQELSVMLEKKQNAPNLNYCTMAERLKERQEAEATAGIEALKQAEQDLRAGGAGAAGQSVELSDFMLDVTRKVKRYTLVVETQIERLAGGRMHPNKEFHFKYTYNFFNHIHTSQQVLVRNEVGERLQVTSCGHQLLKIDKAPMLLMVREVKALLDRELQMVPYSLRHHFGRLQAWVQQKSEAWGLMNVNQDYLPMDPSHADPLPVMEGPKHRQLRMQKGLVGRESGRGSLPLNVSLQLTEVTGEEEDVPIDLDQPEEEWEAVVQGEGAPRTEEQNARLRAKIAAQAREITRLKQALQEALRRPSVDSLRRPASASIVNNGTERNGPDVRGLGQSHPTSSRFRPVLIKPRGPIGMAAKPAGQAHSPARPDTS